MPIVSVLPDVPALDRAFDYRSDVPLVNGTVVRVPLGARRVRGWVVASPLESAFDRDGDLLEISKVVGRGPGDEVIDLCRWASWRWSGRLVSMLRLATPQRVVPMDGRMSRVPRPRRDLLDPSGVPGVDAALVGLVGSILRSGSGSYILESSPTTDTLDVVIGTIGVGRVVVVSPSPSDVDRIARRLRSLGVRVAVWPGDWLAATTADVVIGTRSVVFAPTSDIAAIVVLDEHDSLLQSESSPTWNAREIAVERARRCDVPCLLVSPCPSLEAYRAQMGTELLVTGDHDTDRTTEPAFALSRGVIRDGWSPVRLIDRRGEDTGRSGLFSSELVGAMRDAIEAARPVTCMLNRTGRARLLACRSCSTLVRCHDCGSAMAQGDDSILVCGHCGSRRPSICSECGSSALNAVRVGVTRARDELEALLRVPVEQVVAREAPTSVSGPGPMVRIGTSAVLSTTAPGGLVVFVDFDQELLSPRYRAAEDALSMLVMASRTVGGRRRGGSIIVQTRMPDHEVLVAATRADPAPVVAAEVARRSMLGLPPFASIAWIAGEAAPAFVAEMGSAEGVVVTAAADGEWLARSRHPGRLQDILAGVGRPPGRLRLQVDPHRIGR